MDTRSLNAKHGPRKIPRPTPYVRPKEDGPRIVPQLTREQRHELPRLPRLVVDGVPYEGLREIQVRTTWPDRADQILASAPKPLDVEQRRIADEARKRLADTDHWVRKVMEGTMKMTPDHVAYAEKLRAIVRDPKPGVEWPKRPD